MRTTSSNYYDILGIEPDFEDGDPKLKKLYRNLCKKYHPDLNPESEERFKEITNAYETLSDPQKRFVYDSQTGFNPTRPANNHPHAHFDFSDIFENFAGFGTIFEEILRNSSRFRTLRVPVKISFLDVFKGKTINQKVRLPNGNIIEEKLSFPPRSMNQIRKDINISENENYVLLFTPQIDTTTYKSICEEASDIQFDGDLNLLITFKIPLIDFLQGTFFRTTVLGVGVRIEIPAGAEYGLLTEKPNLSLLGHSVTKLRFIFDMPKLSQDQVKKVKEILES